MTEEKPAEQPSGPAGFESLLSAVEPGRGGKVTSYRPISGGYSRDTAVAEVTWGDGSKDKFILRSDPPGGDHVFTSDRDEEWALLQALATMDSFVIPAPRWYDSTGEHFGTKCIVMDFCEGTPLQLTLDPSKDLSAATDVYLDVAQSFQRAPLDVLPAHLERPKDWDEYIDHAIEVYDKAERDLPDCSPVVRYVSAWLRANKPSPVPLSLIHGDFQPGNILIADGKPPVVIDWEFARIGDPRSDVGYYSSSPLPTNLYQADRKRFLEGYRERTGMSESEMNEEILDYFFVLGMATLFAQMVDGYAAICNGTASGVMNTFLINSVSYFHGRYLEICQPS
jgi:aminoglycoside phosphotransferase (APT) family kinase protein